MRLCAFGRPFNAEHPDMGATVETHRVVAAAERLGRRGVDDTQYLGHFYPL